MQPYFTTKQHGIGMGLTVSYSLLKQVGGWIELDTEPGFGTTVRLFLPAVGPSQAGPIEDPDALRHRDSEYAGRFDGTRVLLVEDDPLVRRSLERTLQSVGCEVGAVGNGDRALELFRDERAAGRSFDVVVTDLTMPGRNDGVQLLRQVRELDPDIPAVLSSGALHRHNTSSYREAGFQFVLRKPFGEPEVRRALSVALAARAE
jgi:CheY-like chemotaxis protein